ncbi:bacteriophage N4 adsorption protein B [Paraburkholderia kururiensis]|uniref:glycosyl transferase family protein n=1 Tax=Paraburkholderia kururiensis TaxID=984307 RepID=UPI0039A450D1
MQLTSVWSSYLYGLDAVALVTAVVIFISTMDDLFLDAFYWAFEIRRMLRGEKESSVDVEALRAMDESWLAIMVPAWKEYEVIARMIENTLATMEYKRYVIFAGTYHNDSETSSEVARMVRRYPGRVVQAAVFNDGPTCKADCLNWIVAAILRYEKAHGIRFEGVVMHDCEDVIHPVELKYFNHAIRDTDFVQLPVLSLPRKWNEFVAGTYMDDFSETHQKDVWARQRLTGTVPGAGVASCYSRRAIEAVMAERNGRPFNTSSLTEDYDFSFRLKALGMKEAFARFPLSEAANDGGRHHMGGRRNLLATREYFPDTLRTAYRQRARWMLGIAFQGWQQLGWKGGWRERYMFFRDRKGMVTSIVSIVAFIVLINYLLVIGLRAAGFAPPENSVRNVLGASLDPLLAFNCVMLAIRLAERYYFVSRLNGPLQGLLSLPRILVNNIINFLAACRAWRIFIGHLLTGRPIAWDKTNHTFLSDEALGKRRRKLGEILVNWGVLNELRLDDILKNQAARGKRLGELLVDIGIVNAESLADALAEQAGLPRVSLANVVAGPFAATLPLAIQTAYRVIPFSTAEDGKLNVAVASPLDEDAQEAVRSAAGAAVAYFIASDVEISAELGRHERSVLPERTAVAPAKMARVS